jgi:S-(hydroxymethyl)glutathione dehydrogenase / alcohol dehydrogenase
MKALVCHAVGNFAVEDVQLEPPRAGEVRVRLAATGVCHSDLSVIDGILPLPLPAVLGHEGAGIIVELGPEVRGLEIGDRVVLSFSPACGACTSCRAGRPQFCDRTAVDGNQFDGTSRVHLGGRPLGVMAMLGCMAEEAVVPATAAVRIDRGIPLDRAALVGCGVMTGVGAAINTARVTPGSHCAVFGCGGVGLSVIQGCRIAGASRIVAVDVAESKLELARRFGATDAVNGRDGRAVEAIHTLFGGGVDFSFEVVGSPSLMRQAYDAVRRGGVATIVGVGRPGDTFPMDAFVVATSGRTLKGSFYGDANPHADFPRLLDLYAQGRLDLDGMVSRTYRIEEAEQAFRDMKENRNARGVIVF